MRNIYFSGQRLNKCIGLKNASESYITALIELGKAISKQRAVLIVYDKYQGNKLLYGCFFFVGARLLLAAHRCVRISLHKLKPTNLETYNDH